MSVAVSVLAMIGGLFAAAVPDPAQAVGEDSGGAYVPVTPTRIVSTDDGLGGSSSPFGSGTTRSYTVLGKAGVPTTEVSAVVVNVSVLHATSDSASSHLVVWPSGETKPAARTMAFEEDNSARSNTTIVKVGAAGKISVYNHSGTVDVNLDVTGYFTAASDETSSGGFVPINPTRVANTMTGEGVPQAKLPQGSSVDVQVSNEGEIPTDATAVFANVEVRSNEKGGSMKIVPAGQSTSGVPPTIKYQDSGPTSSGVMLKLSTAGKVNVSNLTGQYGGNVDFIMDIQGYFSGQSNEGGSYTPVSGDSIYSTTATGNAPLAGGETRSIQVSGLAGIPDSELVGTAVLTLTVRNWESTGALRAYNADHEEPPETSNISFVANEGEPSNGSTVTSMVELSVDGEIKLENTSSNEITVYVSAQGWFSFSDYSEESDWATVPMEDGMYTTPDTDPENEVEEAPEGSPEDMTAQRVLLPYNCYGDWYSWNTCSWTGGRSLAGYTGYRKLYQWQVGNPSQGRACAKGRGYTSTRKGVWRSIGCGTAGRNSVPWGKVLAVPKFQVRSTVVPYGVPTRWY